MNGDRVELLLVATLFTLAAAILALAIALAFLGFGMFGL